MKPKSFLPVVAVAWLALSAAAIEQPKFELKDGDRIVFLGGTFMEREARDGYVETFLTTRWPDRNSTFRNLGWSGDTVWGDARAGFGNRDEGFRNLLKQVNDAKPSVIFVAYGQSESFAGEHGLPEFETGLNHLLDTLAKTGARIVLISPTKHEDLGRPLPDPTDHNKNLRLYVDVMKIVADQRGYPFVNLFDSIPENPKVRLTDNGIHLKDAGYLAAAAAIERGLGLPPRRGGVSEKLRATIIAKNRLYFDSWRPQNWTYILGFRKGEQGRNAVEIPQFDPLVEAKEAEIAKLRRATAVESPATKPPSTAQPAPIQKDPNAPDPEEERKTFQVADGFEVNLFAADPQIAKPIQMNFDAQGRLWVASSSIYPQIKPGEIANDKVVVLEDRDGDGRADYSRVFAGGLLIPTGLAPDDRGGAYVANSTEVVHLADPNGDKKAERRDIVLSGFGTEDTHHIIHTFRWGPDGWLYFDQSVYIHSHIETPWGSKRLGGSGVWRYRPESGQLEIFERGLWNPWGHIFDRWGTSFGTDGAGGGGINYFFPGAAYETANNVQRLLTGLNPGSPKYCALEILSGRHIPDDWQGRLLTADFRANTIHSFQLSEDGSGFASKRVADFIKSTDRAFRPVDIKMGPDGAIYIADWYNPIINHGEVDFRDPRRDHTHGRIWRVTAKGRPLVPRLNLAKASIKELLENLKAPEDWTRQQAKRELAVRDRKEVLAKLAPWVRELDPKDPNIEHNRLEALWVYQTLNVVEPKLLELVLRSPNPNARAAATRVLWDWHDRVSNPLDLLATQVADEYPRTRLEAVRALSRIASPRAIEIATRALDKPMDKWLDYSLWLTANELKDVWLPAFQEGKLTFDGNAQHLAFALQAVGSLQAMKTLMEQMRAGKIPDNNLDSAIDLITSIGGVEEAGALYDLAVQKGSAPMLRALVRMVHQRAVQPNADPARLKALIQSQNEEAIRLAGAWKANQLRSPVTALAVAADTSESVRRAAVEALADLGGPESVNTLTELCAANRPQSVRQMAVAGLATLDVKLAATRAIEVLTGDADPMPLFNAFLQRSGGSDALAVALASAKLSSDAAKLGLRAVQSAGQPNSALAEALRKAAGLGEERKEFSADEMRALIAEVQSKGDAARGEQIFRRRDLSCLQCHAIGGAGGQVGPDLRSLGASAPMDYIVDSIYFPNKAIKEGFHALMVTTKDGEIFTGVKVNQTPKELVLRDASGEDKIVPLDKIKDQRVTGSIMPSGLADALTRAEFFDLVRFISELGKSPAFTISNARVVRRWRVPVGAPSAGRGVWTPAYSEVSGTLPLIDGVTFVSCQIEVSSPGKIKLQLNSAKGLTFWVDYAPVEVKETIILDLAVGQHVLTFGVDKTKRQEGLRVELDEAPGSPGRFQIVSGK